jgi:uncharacterized protein
MQSYDPRYLSGIAHFNRGEYFEAHEVWEDLWLGTQGPARLFYKGLIQAAVALHHARQENQHGAWKLYQRSRRGLAAYEPWYLGLNVASFLVEMGHCLRTSGASNAARTPAWSGPQIELFPLESGPSGPALRPILKESCWPRPESPP